MIAMSGSVPCCGETLEEVLVPLPGSEQFKLQQSRAIETSGELPADCAFLQQSGMLVIGQEPSCSCAPTPTAPQSRLTMRAKAVNHLRIDVVTILTVFVVCQADRYRCVGHS